MRLTLTMFVTLDGVIQAPGGPEEDPSHGFTHGGWQFPYADDADFGLMNDWFGEADAFLLGRRTYDIFSGFWPTVTDPDDPIAGPLNRLPKYVATTRPLDSEWAPTTVLDGDVPAAVARLKAQPGRELQVHGSAQLVQTLMRHDLVDEFRLITYPVVLGDGERLFAGVSAKALRLVDTRHHPSSQAIIAVYQPAGSPRYGSFAAGD